MIHPMSGVYSSFSCECAEDYKFLVIGYQAKLYQLEVISIRRLLRCLLIYCTVG